MVIKMKHNIEIDNIILNNESLLIENQTISKIKAKGLSEINLFNCNIINLEIEIDNNASLIINSFNIIDKIDTNIIIKANNKSSITFNHSFINNGKYNLNIYTDFLKEEGNILLNIHGINNGGTLNTNIDGFVHTDKFNNILDENIRIYNFNNGIVTSNPNMYISTSKVIANHNTIIGSVREDELFYLMSKGINKKEAINLIIKGFLVKIITNNDLKIKMQELIQGGENHA